MDTQLKYENNVTTKVFKISKECMDSRMGGDVYCFCNDVVMLRHAANAIGMLSHTMLSIRLVYAKNHYLYSV